MARVVLAMSGGVDSSVAAVLLRRAGHELIGLFMRTGVGHEGERSDRKQGCCSAIDAGDARRVADKLDVPFHAVNFEEQFGRIMDYFADEYLAGRTPNPCVVCNTWLKFGELWSFARSLDADFIATGHYARVRDGRLYRAADAEKDQTYVLAGVRREVFERVLFPLGDLRKEEVRQLARETGLAAVADKPDSVEICFVPDGDHAAMVKRRRPEVETAGALVDTTGRELARHEGYERFTIGQRKGLGYAAGSRRYVLDIVPESRQVVLGDAEELLSDQMIVSRMNWLIVPPSEAMRCEVKIRYRHQAAAATVNAQGDFARVEFDVPQTAVTPGQAAVFYSGDQVLGGGWIERADFHFTP